VDVEAATNQVINIGADTPYSVNKLADVVAQAWGSKPDIRYLPARNEVQHAYSDHAKARRLFGTNGASHLKKVSTAWPVGRAKSALAKVSRSETSRSARIYRQAG